MTRRRSGITPRLALAWLCAALSPLAAHMVSISTGEIRIEGARAHYQLRMPLYEIAHVTEPERTLLDNIRFSSAGARARLLDKKCRRDELDDAYFCEAAYEFPAPVDRLAVSCSFHEVTVPNHVHLLRARKDSHFDQAVLDLSFPLAELRFQPPGALERMLQQALAGALRALREPGPLLFLLTLVLAARSRRELLALAGAFLAGQALACAVVPLTRWSPSPQFVESAAALTIAYLAVEILLLPEAGHRWAIVGVLGAFHGLYLVLLLSASGFQAGVVLTGAAIAELVLIAAFAVLIAKAGTLARGFPLVRAAAGLLLVVGLGWFFWRLAG